MSRKGSLFYYISVAAIFILMEVAALGMLKYNGILQNNWISKGIHGFQSTVWGGTESITQYFRLKKTNEALAEENYQLLQELRKYEYLYRQQQTAGDFPECRNDCYRYIPASITKISNSRQHNYLIVNKGSEDGVLLHSGIITRQGVIGIVDAVSRHYSYAKAFTSTDMSVSARVGKEGAIGALRWDGTDSRSATLAEIPQHIEISQNDTIYTSGYSMIFPPDIPLGTIERWETVNGATYELKIKLFEDFRQLRYVIVVNNLDEEELKELEQR